MVSTAQGKQGKRGGGGKSQQGKRRSFVKMPKNHGITQVKNVQAMTRKALGVFGLY